MQLQFKPRKAAEIMYLESKKEQTKYHLMYFRGLELKRNYNSSFEGQRTP